MASAVARAYNGDLGAEPPAGSRGRAPGQGIRGQSPLKLKSFCHWNVQKTGKFVPFSTVSVLSMPEVNENVKI